MCACERAHEQQQIRNVTVRQGCQPNKTEYLNIYGIEIKRTDTDRDRENKTTTNCLIVKCISHFYDFDN